MIYQIGIDLFFFILWRAVSSRKFAERVAPLMLRVGQEKTVSPDELLPFFNSGLIYRDGLHLYRAIPRDADLNEREKHGNSETR